MEQPIMGRIEQLTHAPTPKAPTTIPYIIDEQARAEIRKIVREEIGRIYWSELETTYPELVQGLRAKFPALVPDSRELKTQQNKHKMIKIRGTAEGFEIVED